MRRILAGLVLVLMLTGGAAAGPLEEGVAAYTRGDYATALRLQRPLAEYGDAFAQVTLGLDLLSRQRRSAGLRSGAHVVQSRSFAGSSY